MGVTDPLYFQVSTAVGKDSLRRGGSSAESLQQPAMPRLIVSVRGQVHRSIKDRQLDGFSSIQPQHHDKCRRGSTHDNHLPCKHEIHQERYCIMDQRLGSALQEAMRSCTLS